MKEIENHVRRFNQREEIVVQVVGENQRSLVTLAEFAEPVTICNQTSAGTGVPRPAVCADQTRRGILHGDAIPYFEALGTAPRGDDGSAEFMTEVLPRVRPTGRKVEVSSAQSANLD